MMMTMMEKFVPAHSFFLYPASLNFQCIIFKLIIIFIIYFANADVVMVVGVIFLFYFSF